jgi:hypothetical protein
MMSNEDAIEHGYEKSYDETTTLLAYPMYLSKSLIHTLYILILRTNACLILINKKKKLKLLPLSSFIFQKLGI